MFQVHKWLILFILIICAGISYSIGFARGAIILIIIGVLFELGFWVGLFNYHKQDKDID